MLARPLRAFAALALASSATVLVATPGDAISNVCLYDGGTKIVTVIYAGDANEFRTLSREAGGTRILYEGAACGAARVTNTKRIDLTTGAGAQTLDIDLSNGAFAPGVGAEPATSEIEFDVDLGAGTDVIRVTGGSGAERLGFVGSGGVKLNGDGDSDVTLAGTEMRFAYLGGGDDVVTATAGTPRLDLSGQGGDDRLTGGSGNDLLAGGADDDTLIGNAGDDSLYGDAGHDVAKGGDDEDYAEGGPGNDTFDGGAGSDSFTAEAGADGADRINGGPGLGDGVSYSARTTRVVLDPDGNADDGASGEGDRLGADLEDLYGGSGNDAITGNALDNYLAGYGGDDTLKGLAGNDTIAGGDDGDTLRGGDDADQLYHEQGNDVVHGDAGNDMLWSAAISDGADDLRGGPGDDTVFYGYRTAAVTLAMGFGAQGEVGEGDVIGNDVERAYGGSGADTITGNGLDNYLVGGAGADAIDGGSGSDSVLGGVGTDSITGGDGGDYLYGNEDGDDMHTNDGGTDYVYCGTGTDAATDNDAYDVFPGADCEST